MMKKLVLGVAICCGIGAMVCEYVDGMDSQKRQLETGDAYITAQNKWGCTLPKDVGIQEIQRGVDNALRQAGNNPSYENVLALLKIISQNQNYANYCHMMFCECFVDLSKDDEISNRKKALSFVLSSAAIRFSTLYPFAQNDLLDEFNYLTAVE